ncbi:MAG TPA: kelch repeat-containing protein [Candidatus Acidoferrum sp.]|nr:kelch repeat-containing protein [Candidatus Acidoferrum sp.]
MFAAGPAKDIPEALGWYEVPNTQLAAICPQVVAVEGTSGCRAVISAWNGGVSVPEKNLLIFFGGGHFDYYGNEVYALDLNQLSLRRLTEPSPVTNLATCPESYVDGRPDARHTYNGLAYVGAQHSLYLFGGAKSPCGKMSNATWTLDLSTLQWSLRDPHHGDTPAAAPGAAADFDPTTGLVFMTDTRGFYSYDPRSNTYLHLNSYYGVDYHLTGVIDPARRLFLLMGGAGQLWSIDIRPRSKYELKDLSRTQHGCEALMHAAYPGLAYDSRQKLVVGWAGGNTVYVFQPETVTCKAVTYPGGPGPGQPNGTNGRFRYFPALDLFVVVNDWKQNAYTLRLTPPQAEETR